MERAKTTKPIRYVNLYAKLLMGFTVVFSVVFAGAFYWFYTIATQSALNQIRSDMVDTLTVAAQGVSADDLVALVQQGVPRADGLTDDSRYWLQVSWMDQVHGIQQQAWAYTYVKGSKDGEVVSVADLRAKYDPARAYKFLAPITSMKKDLTSGLTRLTVNMDLATDQDGTWVSAYMPVKNVAGESVGAMGLHFSASRVLQAQQGVRNPALLAFAITYLVMFVLLALMSHFLTRSVTALTHAARQIADGDYTPNLENLSHVLFPDEAATLASVFTVMVSKVREREQTLQLQVQELRIEIDHAKRQQQVAEIVESDFFKSLQDKASELRSRNRDL